MNPDKIYKFSRDFTETIKKAAGSFIEENEINKLFSLMEAETADYYFTRESETNLIRILNSAYDKVSLFTDLLRYELLREIIIAVSANSNYLTDILVRNPEYLYSLFNTDYLNSDLTDESCRNEISLQLQKFKTLNSKLNYLRNFKRRETLKIGVKDIIFSTELLKTTEQLSILARAVNSELFYLCYNDTINKYNITEKSDRFCMVSLGKLGGNEINYSSDIDLMLFYDNNEIKENPGLTFFEVLSEAVLLFIKHSSEITEKGYIFRVDFRLRPDGKNSPLCRTINDYMRYYEAKGEDWERQMLIKMDFLCGNVHLYNQFKNFISAFIYPTTFTVSPLLQIAKMKANIELRSGGKDDVKHFPGGIRDIEFSIQALQLLNGGRLKDIRSGNTLIAISLLEQRNILKEKEAEMLKEAYIFFRKTEHFLQLMNDLQTHEIPKSLEFVEKIAAYLKLKNASEFKHMMATYRKNVRSFFESLTIQNQKEIDEMSILNNLSFIDKNRAEKNIKFLKQGTGLLGQKEFDSRTINLFDKIEPALLKYLSQATDPDRVLENFVKIIRSVKFPSIWYTEFANEKFFISFLTICEFSQKAVDMMSINKELGEFYLTRSCFTSDFSSLLPGISNDHIIFSLCIQFALKLINHQIVSRTLSELIHYRIQQAVDNKYTKHNYFIAGQGSFGISEMNFASDVDLTIIALRKENDPVIENDFENFMVESRSFLSPFSVDFRLRPEGQKGPLVWDIRKYETYLKNRARIWEFQALSKVCFCTGNPSLYEDFLTIIKKQLSSFKPAELKKNIKEMYLSILRSNLSPLGTSFNTKKSKGSIIDIEFVLQYLQMLDPANYVAMNCRNNLQKIKFITGFKSEYDFISPLSDNFTELKTIELAVQTLFNQNNTIIPSDKNKKRLLSSFLGYKDDELDTKLKKIIAENSKIFDRVFSN